MSRTVPQLGSSLLAFFLGSTVAWADVTADEVWAEVRGLLESYGQTVTIGAERRENGTLIVTDIVMDMEMPEANGSASAALDEIRFAERGDGTVEVVLSPEYRIISSGESPEGEEFEILTTVGHEGLSIIASGAPDDMTYTYSARSIEARIDSRMEGEDIEPPVIGIAVEAPEGDYVLRRQDGGRAFTSTGRAEGVRVDAEGTDPESSDPFEMRFDMAEVTSTSEGFLPNDADMADLSAALGAGLRAEGGVRYASSTFAFEGSMDGSPSRFGGTTDAGSLDFALTPESIAYRTTGSGLEMGLQSAALPVPELTLSLAESSFDFEMPVARTEDPQDFGLALGMRGLTLSESVWALFDPMGTLPRDPATVALDLGGTAKWLVDIFDPAVAEQSDTVPGELHTLSLNDLEVTVAGARLTGEGDFTFDNADTTTWGGMPAPTGAVELMLTGGNALLDKLVSMGLVPEDQAMGARMMLGLFARPGEGEDTLVSRIEVTPEGQVLANGQRLR